MNRYKELGLRFYDLKLFTAAVEDRTMISEKCEEFLKWVMETFPAPVTDESSQIGSVLSESNLIDVAPTRKLSGFSDPAINALAVWSMIKRQMNMDVRLMPSFEHFAGLYKRAIMA